jgi:hypothetical protein
MSAILILELLLRYGPAVAESAQRMMSTGKDPTQAEWDALWAKAQKPYDTYIEEAEKRAG